MFRLSLCRMVFICRATCEFLHRFRFSLSLCVRARSPFYFIIFSCVQQRLRLAQTMLYSVCAFFSLLLHFILYSATLCIVFHLVAVVVRCAVLFLLIFSLSFSFLNRALSLRSRKKRQYSVLFASTNVIVFALHYNISRYYVYSIVLYIFDLFELFTRKRETDDTQIRYNTLDIFTSIPN